MSYKSVVQNQTNRPLKLSDEIWQEI